MATATLEQRGSWRAKARKGEPRALPAAVPDCPKSLSKGAKVEWERVAPLIRAMRHTTKADLAVLETYCIFYDAWQAALRAKKKFSQGTIERRRVEISAAEANRIMMGAGAKLGLSPSDRTRVREINGGGDEGKEAKSKSRFFSRGSAVAGRIGPDTAAG